MKDDNCIFCLIADGKIPSDTVYEDEEFRVILDLSPASKGHALILPKEHFADITEINEETLTKAILLAKYLAPVMMQALGADGINVVQNNGAAAGQTVRHFHIHLIPRYADGPVIAGWEQLKSDPAEQKELAARIAAALK